MLCLFCIDIVSRSVHVAGTTPHDIERLKESCAVVSLTTSVSVVDFQCVFVQFYPSMKHARFDGADRRFSNSRYLLHGIPHVVRKRQCYALLWRKAS